MKIEREKLMTAAKKVGIPKTLSEKLWTELNSESPAQKLDLSNVLYYFGALLVLLAMSWFMVDALQSYSPKIAFLISLSYLVFFLILGDSFWKKQSVKIPGGLFITLAVSLIPLVVYCLQKWQGWQMPTPLMYPDFFSWVNSAWFTMEIATVIGGFTAFYFYRFPFLLMPIFLTLWYMSMDIVPLLFGNEINSYKINEITSSVFGFCLLVIAYIIDLSSKEDFAFWPYFFGVLTFWGGLSLFETTSEYVGIIYLIVNLGLIFISIILQRIVFVFFGTLGVFIYVSSLFYKYFSDSLGFPIILSFIGIFIIFLGILYHKNYARIESFFLKLMPENMAKWLPRR